MAKAGDNFSLVNKTRTKVPRAPFSNIKKVVLGEDYELSTALLTESEMRKASVEGKHGDTAANVLSFPFSKTSGEILLCPATIRKQAKLYSKTPDDFLVYLFIHGLCHLKGHVHGVIMEDEESQIAKQFGF